MTSRNKNYNEVIAGEVKIIYEELDNLYRASHRNNIDLLAFIEKVTPHLASIEQKIGKSSIDHIHISTEIVDEISNKMLSCVSSSFSDSIIDKLSPKETVEFYANQRKNLMDAVVICRKLESWNMDYAYRIKKFNTVKKEIGDLCQEKNIDTRSSMLKGVDHLKTVGEVTGVVAKETAGCAIELAIKIAIVIVIFLILMAILGVK